MKVLITGALGYMGGRLVSYLRDLPDFNLRLFVPQVPRELAEWVTGLDVREGDLTRPETLEGICDGVDKVIHLAAIQEVDCARDPVAAIRVNVEGTLHLMQALAPSVTQIIFMSTFHVYGSRAKGRVVEETPLAPAHPYAASKAMAEMVVTMHARQHNLGAVVLRASNGFGAPLYPGVDRWELVVNDLCRQAITNGRITIRASSQERDFVALTDIVEAICLVLTSPLDGVEVFNVGSQVTLTVLEVAQQVQAVYQELYGKYLPLEHPPVSSQQNPPSLEFCIDRLRTLGYVPRGSVREGIRDTLRLCEAFRPPQEKAL